MAVDEDLNKRFRDSIAGLSNTSEKRMMGGVMFFLNGNMLGGASRNKDGAPRFMFRVGKDNEAQALKRAGASVVQHGVRRLGGFIHVDATQCNKRQLQNWLSLALSYVDELPPK